MAGATEEQLTPDERARAALMKLRDLAPRTSWNSDTDAGLLPLSTVATSGRVRNDAPALLAELVQGGGGQAPLQDLCVTLRSGGYEVAESFCDAGAVESTLALLTGGTGPSGEVNGRRLAAEALWLMIYDHESSQRLIKAGGHGQVIKLLREEGSRGDAALSGGALRVLGETLYSETRKADLWESADLELLVEALDWALRAEPASCRGPLLATVCNIAALWVARVRGGAIATVLPLVGLMPRLLQELRSWRDDADVLFQSSRLLHALSTRCHFWPENVREPTLAAMRSLAQMQHDETLEGSSDEVRACSQKVLQAVEKLPSSPPAGSLSMMD